MSFWLQNGHGTGEYRGLDDASVEALLRGHYQEDDPDLVAVGQFLQHVRSFAQDPAPAPSAALMDVLSGAVPTPEPTRPLTSWRLRLRAGGSQPLRRRHVSAVRRRRFTPVKLSSVVVAAAVTVLVAVVSSGSVGLLPGATQDVLARVVHTVTPFDFSEHSEPAAVLSESPRERSPGEDEVSGGGRGPSQVQPGQSGQNHPSSLAADRTGGGAQPSGVAAPAGTTTLPARPAPAAPESERQPASSTPTTTSRPLPGDDRISASLSRTPRRGPAQPDPRREGGHRSATREGRAVPDAGFVGRVPGHIRADPRRFHGRHRGQRRQLHQAPSGRIADVRQRGSRAPQEDSQGARALLHRGSHRRRSHRAAAGPADEVRAA